MKKWMEKNGIFEWRLLIPVMLGVLFGLGDGVANTEGRLIITDVSLYLRMMLFVLLFVLVFVAMRLWIDRRLAIPVASIGGIKFLNYQWSWPSLMKLWTIIVVCWLPYIITLFPGVYWSDTSKQLLEYYGYVPFTDHHPFVLTYLFGWFADFGNFAFGNAIYGLYCLIVVQLCMAPALFAMVILYTRKLGLSRFGCHAELAFFALFPVFPVMFSSLAKDTLSVLFFLPFCLILVEVIRTKGAVCKRKWVIPLMLILALLSCITKKPCVYVIVPSLIFVCFLQFTKIMRTILVVSALFVATVMLVIFPKVVLPALNIAPGGAQETIPFAIQQVAHDVKYGANEMSDEDKQLIDDFLTIPYEDIADAYNPVIADPVKGTSLNNPERMGDFIKLWLRKTVENPVGHLESWMGLVRGWFGFQNNDSSPNYMVVCTESAWYYDPITEVIPQWPLKAFGGDIARSVYDAEQSVPILNILFFRSFWASIVPFFLLYVTMRPGRGKFHRLISMMPVNMTFAYLMLTPVSGMGGEPTRYLLQLICVLPLFAVFVVVNQGRDNTISEHIMSR